MLDRHLERVPLWPAGAASSQAVEGAHLTVLVEVPGGHYPIHVGAGLLEELGVLLPARAAQRGALVTSETLAPLYGQSCRRALETAGWRVSVLTVPDGEEHKSLAQASQLYAGMLAGGLDRGSAVLALGGGVIGDLSGFVAGTYMRGLEFVQIPTTLLAQVDASIGGKTAVDLPQGKNLVGVFHQPRMVVADVGVLASLPQREFRSGMAEIIKHAVIADAEMFAYLESTDPAELERSPSCLRQLVARNCQIKAAVVAADPREKGVRACLNFGHTVGHALEAGAGNWGLRHGEAVALGMVAESRLAVRLGLAQAEVPERLWQLARRWSLAAVPAALVRERAHAALRHDKKVVNGRLQLPLASAVGQVSITDAVPVAELLVAVDEILDAGGG